MSRSIHTTRRELWELQSSDFSRGEEREAALARARERYLQKRRIKAAVLRERRRLESGVTPSELVPVLVTETGEHVHHVATEDDVREVLRRLPPGIVDGLARVELEIGAEYQAEDEARDPRGAEPDPLIGRVGWERFPGVWSGGVLGTYRPDGAVVRVNAYVFRDDAPLREVWEILLKLEALSTLVHEVGHHYDCTMRVARGRWLASSKDRLEMYAEERQHVWMQSAIIPYLRATYPSEIERVEEWVGHHGGVRLSFEALAGDPRGTRKHGAISLNESIWSMRTLLEELVRDVLKGEPLQTCRVEFARFLHYREDYEAALRSVHRVLSEEPHHVEALTLRADIYVHQGRHVDALEIARGVLARVPEHVDAWEVVADAFEALERWQDLRDAAARLVELHGHEKWRLYGALIQRARAAARLGALAEARADLATLEREYPGRSKDDRRVQQLCAELDAALTSAAEVADGST